MSNEPQPSIEWRCRHGASCVCTGRDVKRCPNASDVSENGSYLPPAYPASAIHEVIEKADAPAGSVLEEAAQLTNRTRKDVYAHPSVNFDRIARMWSVILGVDVTPEQHALCMIAVKISRLVESPGHRDSLVDIAGYARTIELLAEGGE